MAVTITYNGANPFGTRTPFVSREYNRVDLNGYITGINRLTISGTRKRPSCDATFANYKADMDLLRSYFTLQFKQLVILDGATEIFSHPEAKIISISFPESSFSGFYRYEIIIDCFDSYLGEQVVEPVDEWTTDEDANGITTITRTLSARGLGDRAYEKARDFVLSLADGQNDILISLEDGAAQFLLLDEEDAPVLLDEWERRYPLISRRTFFNRLTGEFRMVETWVYQEDYEGAGYGTIIYQTGVSESNGETTVEISGDIQVRRIGASSNEISNAKLTFDTIDFQAIAQQEYQAGGGTITLGSQRSMSVSENPDLGTVSFSMSWSSLAESSPYIIDTSTVTVNKIGGPTCFRYTGTVKSDSGCVGSRYEDVKTFFEAVNWDARVATNWTKYGTGERLTANAKSKSVTYNPISGEISFSVTYCADPEIECAAIEVFKYTMTWTPSITRYAPNPILDGQGFYDVQNLGYKNRKGFAITGSAKRVKCYSKEAAMGEIRSRVNLIMVKNFPGSNRILISNEITEDKTGDFYNFSFSWNANAD